MCVFRWWSLVKRLLHTLHSKGFSPVWVRSWFWSTCLYPKLLWHVLQVKTLSRPFWDPLSELRLLLPRPLPPPDDPGEDDVICGDKMDVEGEVDGAKMLPSCPEDWFPGPPSASILLTMTFWCSSNDLASSALMTGGWGDPSDLLFGDSFVGASLKSEDRARFFGIMLWCELSSDLPLFLEEASIMVARDEVGSDCFVEVVAGCCCFSCSLIILLK